jgi:hypothetical protein
MTSMTLLNAPQINKEFVEQHAFIHRRKRGYGRSRSRHGSLNLGGDRLGALATHIGSIQIEFFF